MSLRTNAETIVDEQGQQVRLRGVCIGGWMNLENFINGYSGSAYGQRVVMEEVLGKSRTHFFFERMMDYFLGPGDLAFLRSLGVNTVRLPFNYRHFESDADPFAYIEAGFERLARAVAWCEAEGLYAILDLHAVAGWQNPDWHSDNGNRVALFWQTKHYQDRFVAFWEELARRFSGNRTVAGYNVMNEPVTGTTRGRFTDRYQTDWAPLNAIYHRVVEAIRAIDPDHIIFLEGDLYSTRFAELDSPFAENLVYSSHNYNAAGFGHGQYPGINGGEHWDAQKQVAVFEAQEGTRFCKQHQVPLWVGEFGSVYNGPSEEVPARLRAMDDQLATFNQGGAHWTAWTYKDVGTMGWVMVDPDSEYLERISRVLELKGTLNTDSWAGWRPQGEASKFIDRAAEAAAVAMNDPQLPAKAFANHFRQAALDGFLGGLLQPVYAEAFKGLSEVELDRVLASFAIERCCKNEGLLTVVRKHL